MSKPIWIFCIVATLLIASMSFAVFSSSSSFQLKKPTPTAGGSESTSPSYRLSSLVGQTAIGRTSSSSYNTDHGFYSEAISQLSAVEGNPDDMPTLFKLGAVYPNPFNPTTKISYEVPQPCRTVLKIYNVKGQLIRTLLNEERPAGRYDVIWNGQDDHGAQTASGIYLLKMNAGDFAAGRKITLLK